MDLFARDALRFGTLTGFKYFDLFLRNKEELILKLINRSAVHKDVPNRFLIGFYSSYKVPHVWVLNTDETISATSEELRLCTLFSFRKKPTSIRIWDVVAEIVLLYHDKVANPFAVDHACVFGLPLLRRAFLEGAMAGFLRQCLLSPSCILHRIRPPVASGGESPVAISGTASYRSLDSGISDDPPSEPDELKPGQARGEEFRQSWRRLKPLLEQSSNPLDYVLSDLLFTLRCHYSDLERLYSRQLAGPAPEGPGLTPLDGSAMERGDIPKFLWSREARWSQAGTKPYKRYSREAPARISAGKSKEALTLSHFGSGTVSASGTALRLAGDEHLRACIGMREDVLMRMDMSKVDSDEATGRDRSSTWAEVPGKRVMEPARLHKGPLVKASTKILSEEDAWGFKTEALGEAVSSQSGVESVKSGLSSSTGRHSVLGGFTAVESAALFTETGSVESWVESEVD